MDRSSSIRNKTLRYLRNLQALSDAEITFDSRKVLILRSEMEQLESKLASYVKKQDQPPSKEQQRNDPVQAAIFGVFLLLRLVEEGAIQATEFLRDINESFDPSDAESTNDSLQGVEEEFEELRESVEVQENIFLALCAHFDADPERLR